jgi:hydroxysqualene dehydroxylase
MTRPDVVVVGAGFAGLAAATALAEGGARVLVLEARPRLGGRATAFQDRVTGELVDNGQHVLFACYRETLSFLRRVGASGNVWQQPTLSVPYVDADGRRSVLRCPRLPAPFHLVAAVLGWDALPWRDRLSVLRMAPALVAARREVARTGRVTLRSSMTVSQWLLERGQSATLKAWLWEPLAVAALNQSPDEAQAAPFLRILAEMFGPDPDAAALILPTRPLHLMYAEPARAYIESKGGEVRVGAPARVLVDDQKFVAVDVRGERVSAGHAISSVPWSGIRTLFADPVPPPLADLVARAAGMASKPIVTVNLWYDRQVMDEPFVGLPGRATHWIFDKRRAFGAEASHLSLVTSDATALASEGTSELVSRAAREVEAALPAARHARLLRGTVVREKHATFSLAAGQPPRPGARTAIARLWLAGDWIETGLPGTIEGAVVSGHAAARAILTSPS